MAGAAEVTPGRSPYFALLSSLSLWAVYLEPFGWKRNGLLALVLIGVVILGELVRRPSQADDGRSGH
jgi:uncharacterized membrane protein